MSLAMRNHPAHDGINSPVPLGEPELPGRWKGALRFQGADDKGEFVPFWGEGWAGNEL